MKFNQNPCSWSRVVPCGQTIITKLMIAFRNFVNALKNDDIFKVYILITIGTEFYW